MHSNGIVWFRGKGAILEDADGKEYLDGLAGLWNNTAGHGQQSLVDAASQQMATLPYASGYTGSTNPKAIELAERLSEMMYPKINHFFFTSGGGESSEVLEAQRQAGENEGDFEAVGLSRGDVGRDVRHRNQQLLADVRTENPRICPHPFSLSLSLPGS